MQQGQGGVGQRDPAAVHELSRLLVREAQLRGADLREAPRQPRAVQPERRLLASDDDQSQLRGQPGHEELEPPQRIVRAQLVQVVDHQHDRLLERVQVRQEALDDGLTLERRRGGHPLHQLVLADGAGELVDDRQPEALRIALVALNRDPGDAIGRPLGLDPGPHQHGLAAARGAAYENDLPGAGRRQPVEEQPARHKPARSRQALEVGVACPDRAHVCPTPTLPSDVARGGRQITQSV